MYKNSTAPLNNTALWHYLGTKRLDFRRENNITPGKKYSIAIYIVRQLCLHNEAAVWQITA